VDSRPAGSKNGPNATPRYPREVYLAAGTATVLLVDLDRRTMDVFDTDGAHHAYDDAAIYAPERFPGLTLSLAELFAELNMP